MSIQIEDNAQIKEVIKQALVEAIHEQKDLFSELFANVIEDMGLVNAIKEGEKTESVSKEEVFQALVN